MSLPTPQLHTDRLTLRPFEVGDLDALYEMMSNPRVLEFWDAPVWEDASRAQTFLSACHEMSEGGTGARFVVESTTDKQFLGWCGVTRWNPTFRSASFGYCFFEQSWGKGYATEVGRSVLQWAFDTLDLNRIQAETDTRNSASARVLEKLGFVREGTLREDCIVSGVVSDSRVFGLLRRDWEQTL